ncbi:MAG: aconitate hydratase AcnA [Chlorobium sp.]|uniref:aconitate hydratase AcnA n=1 Tax=Chlorobium sp. TaxID=1095 RepID=UPI0025C0F72B|nr:aconitate hydratase AcnA [Chlorobium sp.]MCF8215584.1 aconitate hydratase AcnA [Chlorobium sp.]MCF8270362.1 aconitate hydratase AcnA [Chlorobium sp.]MCF8286731.1 aconitate hydratase AcnA [Chlorobium sp.]MCF8290253.1 aconitate hydratase AcnA [Chlorobium sp.]MCF8384412.1 aconitate hydratase AcnA [Chlorobium sp.]
MSRIDPGETIRSLLSPQGRLSFYSLHSLASIGFNDAGRLPKSLKVLLEASMRGCDGYLVTAEDISRIASWQPAAAGTTDIAFRPSRVVLQDFTGVPAIVDLAALRDACVDLGGDPERINPLVPCDLVIDHSVQVDFFADAGAQGKNLAMEYARNHERYAFLKWGQSAFRNFRVVPPGTGIVHQVNIEYLSGVVAVREGMVYPDSLVGTDSHTTMVNGLGVAGWGVGGIEAEAVMLGQPISISLPRVTGVRVTGALREGVTATDLVLTVTQQLRKVGVVGDFVEFFGPGLDLLRLPDRATIANMAPEYGATMGFFPVDDVTVEYLRMTGREAESELAERYCKEQGLWRDSEEDPLFSRVVELDLSVVEPSIAGPKRPQDRVSLASAASLWRKEYDLRYVAGSEVNGASGMEDEGCVVPVFSAKHNEFCPHSPVLPGHGAVVIAAITSCTNTSNPAVIIAAGLVARAARKRGLTVKPWVKTSLAPGSRVVTDYLDDSGLTNDLDALGFSTVGYGCTTCIGNSGPLPEAVSDDIEHRGLVVASVLSGNRNFEGRIHPMVKANYLASPPLVVAYAIAGTLDIDLLTDPLGSGNGGEPVYLRDLWPLEEDISGMVTRYVRKEQFVSRYRDVFQGTGEWQSIDAAEGDRYEWEPASSYIRKPPFFEEMSMVPSAPAPVQGARALAIFGDSVTTDHISPAGTIRPAQPAGLYLRHLGISSSEFNSYGSRRGNHEVMMRGTFSNIRIRNLLAGGIEGGYTTWFSPDGTNDEIMTIYDAAMRYRSGGVPLVILAGSDYGMGSSRDWAAKGTLLLGVRAVLARSFERIHRSNLVGMGVLPLEFTGNDDAASLGLDGSELFDIPVDGSLSPGGLLQVTAHSLRTGQKKIFSVVIRIDTRPEADYYRNGGILQTVLRRIVQA